MISAGLLHDRLRELYDAGAVKRLHTVPVIQPQTDAEHVYGTLVLADLICREEGLPQRRKHEVMMHLLYHDAPEVVTGDVPAPVKIGNPPLMMALLKLEEAFYKRLDIELEPLDAQQQHIVAACDTLDLVMKCIREVSLGNNSPRLHLVFNNCLRYLEVHMASIKCLHGLRAELAAEWSKYAR